MKAVGVFLKKLLLAVLGIGLSSFGIALFYFANFGSDPVSVFIDGIHIFFGITYGTALNGFNGVVLILIFLFCRRKIQIGLLLSLALSGILLDLFTDGLHRYMGTEIFFAARLCCLCFGVLLLSIGTGVFFCSELGSGPLDTVLRAIQASINRPYRSVRIASDGLFAVSGFLLGGVVGWGTICSLLLAGPLVEWTVRAIRKSATLDPVQL